MEASMWVVIMLLLVLIVYLISRNNISGTKGAFNQNGKGGQDFSDARIRTGAIGPPGSLPGLRGTAYGFNNNGDGVQTFKGANIETGANDGAQDQLNMLSWFLKKFFGQVKKGD